MREPLLYSPEEVANVIYDKQKDLSKADIYPITLGEFLRELSQSSLDFFFMTTDDEETHIEILEYIYATALHIYASELDVHIDPLRRDPSLRERLVDAMCTGLYLERMSRQGFLEVNPEQMKIMYQIRDNGEKKEEV